MTDEAVTEQAEKITAGGDLTIKRRDELRQKDAEIARLRAQRDQLVAALNLTMIGGNHLANVLIGRLGGGFAAKYPPSLDHEVALRSMGATDTYEVWCCWAAIMTARAAIAAVEEAKR